ncbi:MAG: hypothetical protein VX589_18610, partial [Myxococcota bacterium]|nr:hypothetical protein [Myxococcota bacterium]
WAEFDKVLENFDFYRREFERNPQCFADRECTRIRADSHTKSAWGGIIEMETRYAIQYRWVDTEYGRMVLHRFWLKERADGDSLDVKMHANYYIGVAMADGARATKPISASFRQAANGVIGLSGNDIETLKELLNSAGTLRVHANWFSIEQPLGDDFALEQLIQTQITDSQRLDTWLANHPEQVTCTVSDIEAASEVGGAGGMSTMGNGLDAPDMSSMTTAAEMQNTSEEMP